MNIKSEISYNPYKNAASSSALSQPSDYPYITIALKGPGNSGKSTLFNSIFGQNISEMSMHQKTLCQVILSENESPHGDYRSISQRIASINSQVSHTLNANVPIEFVKEISEDISPLQMFFDKIDGICYRIIETIGFGDHTTDEANHSWFQKNTKWFDILLFVTDTVSNLKKPDVHSLFVQTCQDLKNCSNIGKKIPIVIIINKSDSSRDEEIDILISDSKRIADSILRKVGLEDHPCSTLKLSAKTILMYRQFVESGFTFDNMNESEICDLAKHVLGSMRGGRARLLEHRDEILYELKDYFERSRGSWQSDIGVNTIVHEVNNVLANGRRIDVLIGQLRTLIYEYSSIPSNLHDHLEVVYRRMEYILKAFKCYSKAFNVDLLPEQQETLLNIKNKAIDCFQNTYQSFRWCNQSLRLHDCMKSVKILQALDKSSNHSLFSPEEWRNIMTYIMHQKSSIMWNYSYPGTPDHSQSNNSSPMSISKSSTFLSSVRYNSQLPGEKYEIAINTLFEVLRDPQFREVLDYFITDVIIPIIRGMTDSISGAKVFESNYLLKYLESELFEIVHSHASSAVLFDLAFAFILKKIEIRKKDFLGGYTTCFRELLLRNDEIRKFFYFDFYEILNEPIPLCDLNWVKNCRNRYNYVSASNRVNALPRMSLQYDMDVSDENEKNSPYDEEVVNHPALTSERLFIKLFDEINMPNLNLMESSESSASEVAITKKRKATKHNNSVSPKYDEPPLKQSVKQAQSSTRYNTRSSELLRSDPEQVVQALAESSIPIAFALESND